MRSFVDFYFLGAAIGHIFRFIIRILVAPIEFGYTVRAGFPHATFEEFMHTAAVCVRFAIFVLVVLGTCFA